MKAKNYITLFVLLFIVGTIANAQQDLTMYNLRDIPQSVYSNPSNQFNGKFYIGIPVLSSNYYSVSNTGFAYSDAIKKRGDSLVLDFKSLIGELKDENFTSFNAQVEFLSFGFALGKNTQINVNVTEHFNFKFNYTKDFVRFIYEGNAAFEDNTANFENIGFSMNHFREFGAGISHQFTDKLRLGTRLKYLYGLENIYSNKTDISLTTNPETYAITANADVEINTSGVNDFDGDNYLSGRGNTGFGVDFGANYDLNNRLSLNASVLDIGYINWQNDAKSYVIEDGEYTYSGIEIDAFTAQEDSVSGEASFDRVLDSLEEAFKVKENEDGYTAPLVSRVYLGANYKLTEKTVVGGVIQSEVFKGRLHSSFTVSANQKFFKWLTMGASYTAINGAYNNLGVGLNINPGPVQFYVVSDNVLGAFRPQHARYAQVRFGINLIFGSEKTREIHPLSNGVSGGSKKDRGEKEETEDTK